MPPENPGFDPQERLIFMCISLALGPKEQSFEEVRVADYLKAYIATGKSPPSCPTSPTSNRERIELGLPPLFKPHVVVTSALGPDNPGRTSSGHSIFDAKNIPTIQSFRAARVGGEPGGAIEMYQSLASQPEFLNFSHEELRCDAYAKGSKYPPHPLPLDQPLAPLTALLTQHHSPRTTSPTLPAEDLQSLSAARPYSQHSVEELRLAFLQSGRQLTSAEIMQLKPPPAASKPTPSSLSRLSTGGTTSFQLPVRPF